MAEALLEKEDPKAVGVFVTAFERAKAQGDENEILLSRNGLARAYGHKGDFAMVETLLRENLTIFEKRGDAENKAATLTMLAQADVELGRYYDALARYSEIEKISGLHGATPSVESQIDRLLAKCDIYLHLRAYDQAQEAAGQAIELSSGSGFRDRSGRAERLAGRICLAEKQYDCARTHFLNAGKFDFRGLVFEEGLVEVYLASDDFSHALEELSKAAKESLDQASDELLTRYYTQRGLAHWGLGKWKEAMRDFEEAIERIEYSRLDVAGSRSFGYLDAGSFAPRIRAYRGMMEINASLHVSGLGAAAEATIEGKPVPVPVLALHFAELARARGQFDSIASAREEALRLRLPKDLQDRLAWIQSEKRRQVGEAKAALERGELPRPEYQAAEEKLTSAAIDVLKTLRKDYPYYAATMAPGFLCFV
jgi:tetratricopeptide (TPR) repeat protein